MKHIDTNPPAEGTPILVSDGQHKKVAYFCDGNLYYLEYDPHLGVLRKQVLHGNFNLWTEIL